ncbi:MAG: SoxR reducing system RseC family protein [Bacteroidales bacterium]
MDKRLKNIEHQGVVEDIKDNVMCVRIRQLSACASCHSKSYCGIADSSEKIIEVNLSDNENYKVGDEVIVVLEQNLGYKALLMGYMLPLLILVLSLVFMLQLTENEALAALTAIGIMVIYYAFLFAFKNKLRKTFSFKVRPQNSNLNGQ